MKKILYFIFVFISFWIGAFLAVIGYANASKEERKRWDKTFHLD